MLKDAIRAEAFFPLNDIEVVEGDPDENFRSADQVLAGEYYSGLQEQFYMEPLAAIVVPRLEGQELEVYASAHNLLCMQVRLLSRSKCHTLITHLSNQI